MDILLGLALQLLVQILAWLLGIKSGTELTASQKVHLQDIDVKMGQIRGEVRRLGVVPPGD